MINENQTMPAELCDTPSCTVSRIAWLPVGLGTTTQGWRPHLGEHPAGHCSPGTGWDGEQGRTRRTTFWFGTRDPPRVSHTRRGHREQHRDDQPARIIARNAQ